MERNTESILFELEKKKFRDFNVKLQVLNYGNHVPRKMVSLIIKFSCAVLILVKHKA